MYRAYNEAEDQLREGLERNNEEMKKFKQGLAEQSSNKSPDDFAVQKREATLMALEYENGELQF